MALWFVTIAVLGIWGISQHPSVLIAIDPRYGASYLLSGGWAGFLVLGAVFLCVTGAEALYADMGHFGARPIRLAWSGIVFPSLILNYAGQSAIVLEGASTANSLAFDDVTYYVGHETIVHREDGKGLAKWERRSSPRWNATPCMSPTSSGFRAKTSSNSAGT